LIELFDRSQRIIYREDIPLLELPKEELPPTSDLSENLRGKELPLQIRLALPQALPQLTVQLIFEATK